MFAILVLMALFTTFITTPVVVAIYKPSRSVNPQIRQHRSPNPSPLIDTQEKLHILACIHGTCSIPSLINFIESIRPTNKSNKLKLYVMHLTELTDSSSSILMVQRSRKSGFPFINRFQRGTMHDQISTTFQAYGQLGQVTVRYLTSISSLTTIHEDICHVAEEKGVAMIILPFHIRWRGEDEEAMENIGQGWREVNQRVLQSAPCSVVVLIDRGVSRRYKQIVDTNVVTTGKRVCVVFIGGPDDRKVLELGNRMAEHPAIRLSIVRFTSHKEATNEERNNNSSTCVSNLENEKELDEVAINEFKTKCLGSVEYIEKQTHNITEEVLAIGRAEEYELVIVGKGPELLDSTIMMDIKDYRPEHAELGTIGDLLTSSGQGIKSSVLVIRDQQLTNSSETSLRKTARAKNIVTNTISEIESCV